MAFRIDSEVAGGEIDNRVKGRVTGVIEFAGGLASLRLDLAGNTHPDIAGSWIRFRNPSPEPPPPDAAVHSLRADQIGVAGDITASHRVRDGACHCANALSIEWFSKTNGRVVLEALGFEVEVVEGPLWTLTEADRREQAERASAALGEFFGRLEAALAQEENIPPAEARMDAEAARMEILNDRILRRLREEGANSADDWERVYEEESARLRRERGEPEVDEEARQEWMEELNAAEAEAISSDGFDALGGERIPHRLVQDAMALSMRVRDDGLIPEDAAPEHPLAEVGYGLLFATGKLAGALHGVLDEDEWPPAPLSAPAVLVFLKKARGYLQDVLLALDSVDEEKLATPEWRHFARKGTTEILEQTQALIEQARAVLGDDE